MDAVDQETAAAQQVADAHGIPFLGIRGMSDGPGDPLNLPGYPFTFFVYKQIAADNAAIVTEAFLRELGRQLTASHAAVSSASAISLARTRSGRSSMMKCVASTFSRV